MMKKILTIISLIFILGCKQENKWENMDSIVSYNSSNNKESEIEFYKDSKNKPFKIQVFKQNYDSIILNYKNGKKFKEGKITKDGVRFGKWNLYDPQGKLREIREFYNIQGSPILNRVWFLNKKGDTLAWRSQDSIFKQKEFLQDTLGQRNSTFNYFIFSKDTLEIGEPLKAIAQVYTQILDKYDSDIIVLLAKENNNFNSDFSNYQEVKFDTFLSPMKDTLNRFMFKENHWDKNVVFWKSFKTPGRKILRGYVQEQTEKYPFKKDSVGEAFSRIYFEKEVLVLDSIN